MGETGSSAIATLESKFYDMMSSFEARLQSARSTDGVADVTLEKLAVDFNEFRMHTIDCLNEVRSMITNLDDRMDDLENYSRRNCLLIHGIPEREHENTDTLVTNFFNENFSIKDFKFSYDMLDRSHRLGPVKNKPNLSSTSSTPRPIIAKFTSYNIRRLFWTNKRQLKGRKIFMSESLTVRRLQLYIKVKAAVGPVNAWTSDGRIYVSLSGDGKKRKVIRNLSDLDGCPRVLRRRGITTRSRAAKE